jgi:hypothetical protein
MEWFMYTTKGILKEILHSNWTTVGGDDSDSNG